MFEKPQFWDAGAWLESVCGAAWAVLEASEARRGVFEAIVSLL